MPHRHVRPTLHASIELALIGVAAHCVADVHCR
ncbi:Ms4533A family Cys-rich leader peptide [Streptomyces sp. NBC_01476]|nr:Ms4533A family Cys-rich leader peptide [Streptomyces sp. NBC_01476]